MTWITPDFLTHIRETLKNTPVPEQVASTDTDREFQRTLATLSDQADRDSLLREKIGAFNNSGEIWHYVKTSYLSYCENSGIPVQHRVVAGDTSLIKGYNQSAEMLSMETVSSVVRNNRFLNKRSRQERNAICQISFHLINHGSDWLLRAYQNMPFFDRQSMEHTCRRPNLSEIIKDVVFNKADRLFAGQLFEDHETVNHLELFRIALLGVIIFTFVLALRPVENHITGNE